MRRTLALKRDVLTALGTAELARIAGGAANTLPSPGCLPTRDADCTATRTCVPTCLDLTCSICDD